MTKINSIKAQIQALYPECGISPERVDEWCDVLEKNYSKFEGKDFDGIYEILDSLRIATIDEEIVKASASAIAHIENAEMNIDKKAATVFMAVSKNTAK